MLSPSEDFWLRWHADHSNNELAERARLVLEAETGLSAHQMAASLGLSEQAVTGVLQAFEHQRLAGFPRPYFEPEQFLELQPERVAHARHVAGLVQRLFGATGALHHLPGKTRRLLECAALLWPLVGLSPRKRDRGVLQQPGPELLDGATLAGFSPREQAIISCVLRFQRTAYRPDRDPDFTRLRPTQQEQVRQLAALLQAAGGLDHSHTQSTALLGADISSDCLTLRVSGPSAELDGAQACRQSRLWQPVFHLALHYALGPGAVARENGSSPQPVDGAIPLAAIIGREMAQALRICLLYTSPSPRDRG